MRIKESNLKYVKLFCKAITEGVIAKGLAIAEGAGVPESQLAALRFLVANPASTLADVASALGVSPPAATRLIDGLVKRGMVRRVQSEVDRRTLVLSPTARGEELVMDVEEEEMEGFSRITSQMDGEGEGQLLEGIRHFIEAVLKRDGVSLSGLCLHCGEAHDPDCVLAPFREKVAKKGRE